MMNFTKHFNIAGKITFQEGHTVVPGYVAAQQGQQAAGAQGAAAQPAEERLNSS